MKKWNKGRERERDEIRSERERKRSKVLWHPARVLRCCVEIGRAHISTLDSNAHIVYRLLLEKKKKK
jgi:hypothetical protein